MNPYLAATLFFVTIMVAHIAVDWLMSQGGKHNDFPRGSGYVLLLAIVLVILGWHAL